MPGRDLETDVQNDGSFEKSVDRDAFSVFITNAT